ncbi:MAG: lytic transglycosylase domain-containing protein [Deltaproteobacteria bacterium]|jgi:soluble lytic murein transglycosylase-like protein|nr:lytic transglycosylase domain-containing protein [Deltaproteobacteria bacterium]
MELDRKHDRPGPGPSPARAKPPTAAEGRDSGPPGRTVPGSALALALALFLAAAFAASDARAQTFAPPESDRAFVAPAASPGETGLSADAGREAAALANQAKAPAPDEKGFFAPPPPPPPPPPKPKPAARKNNKNSELVVEEFSYYTFRDEKGVVHLTDAPVDPRFQQVTIQVTISRGLAPYRRLNLDKVKPFILKAAERYSLDPALIASIIRAESAFDPKAVSWAGARGLMQLMPKTALMMGVTDSFDPEQNIMGGSRYLRDMLNRFNGNTTLAVAAYNCGPERVARVGRIPDIAETRNYVKIVMANLGVMAPFFANNQKPKGDYASKSVLGASISFPDPGNLTAKIEGRGTALMAPAPEIFSPSGGAE